MFYNPNILELKAIEFYGCTEVYGITEKQKQYLDALIDLVPLKPDSIAIDLSRVNNAYVFFRYTERFDYPIKLEYLEKSSVSQFLDRNVPALFKHLIQTGGIVV